VTKKPKTLLIKELELLLWLCRSELDVATTQRIQARCHESINWSYLVDTAIRNRVFPLVYTNLRAIAATAIPAPLLQTLKRWSEHSVLRNLTLAKSLLEIQATMVAHSLTVVPFKGPVLAHMIYHQPAYRSYLDLDFLVSPTEFEAAGLVFQEMGLRVNQRNDASYYRQAQFASPQLSLVVDLHYALTPIDCYVNLPTGSMLERLIKIPFQQIKMLSLCPEDLFMVLCVDGAKCYWRSLLRLVDLAEFVRNQPLDWSVLLQRAQELGCAGQVWLGLSLIHRWLEAPLPEAVLEAFPDWAKQEMPMAVAYGQFFKVAASPMATLQWHRLNWRSLDSNANRLKYLYRLGKFSVKAIPFLKQKIRT
jgi:hypothetical protein